MTLEWLWFVLVGVLLTGYAVLDGFDLGAGVLYPFIAHDDAERGLIRTAIGPVWDGNEVWLLTGGGALFAAFPAVYASTFSGFYLAIMLVLFGLIFRAVSIEYRSRDAGFARVWDAAFFGGSLLPALLVGVAVGNVIRGIPLNANGDYTGTFLQLLNWYALLIGLLGLCAIVTHGAAWLAVKTEGAVQARAIKVRGIAQIVCVLLFVLATVATLFEAPRASDNVFGAWYGWLAVIVVLGAVVWARYGMLKGNDRVAFLGTALTIVGVGGIFAVSNYPDMVPARGTAEVTSLTVSNSASGSTTLTAMLIITLIGFPIMLGYTIMAYRLFKGKVPKAHSEY
jgi:cytochrome bd ubiquinol oxidase subunit II